MFHCTVHTPNNNIFLFYFRTECYVYENDSLIYIDADEIACQHFTYDHTIFTTSLTEEVRLPNPIDSNLMNDKLYGCLIYQYSFISITVQYGMF